MYITEAQCNVKLFEEIVLYLNNTSECLVVARSTHNFTENKRIKRKQALHIPYEFAFYKSLTPPKSCNARKIENHTGSGKRLEVSCKKCKRY